MSVWTRCAECGRQHAPAFICGTFVDQTGTVVPDRRPDPTDAALAETFTAADLISADLPELSFAVPGLLPEGVTFLVGKPKTGKSYLALNIATAVATGGNALGMTSVERGDVLYCALEDGARRLQDRLGAILADEPPPSGLRFCLDLQRLDVGGLAVIDRWHAQTDNPRLCVVDVFQKVRARTNGKNLYAEDYDSLGAIQRLATDRKLAILILHHANKRDATDVIDNVSGSTGLTGVADTVLIMQRARNETVATLLVVGRDVEEAEHRLDFAPDTGTWSYLGDASEERRSDELAEVLEILDDAGEDGMSYKELAVAVGKKPETMKVACHRWAKDDHIEKMGQGRYRTPCNPCNPVTNPAVTAVTAVTEVTGVTAVTAKGTEHNAT